MKRTSSFARSGVMSSGIRMLLGRALSGIGLLLALTLTCFGIIDLAPGDFLSDAALNPQLSREATEQLRARAGLHQSFGVRYLMWLQGLFRGELGPSFAYGIDASALLFPRVAATVFLNASALVVCILLAAPAALFAAAQPSHGCARVAGHLAQASLAVPEIVVVLLLLAASVHWEIRLPGSLESDSALSDHLRAILVPGAALVFGALPVFFRHIRSAFQEALAAPYVVAARHAGIPRQVLFWRYVFPAAANPLISLFGVTVGGLMSASLVVETATAWPGLGPMLLESVLARDSYVVVGAVMLAASALLVGNLAADFLLLRLDPRIRR